MQTLVNDYEYISKIDVAVDRSAPDFEQRWQQYLDGMAEPPLVAGRTPARFRLRHLADAERDYLTEVLRSGEDENRIRAAVYAAAMIGLVGVAGLSGEDGRPLKVAFEVTRWGLIRIKHATADSLEALAHAMPERGLQAELGGVVFERMRARPS